MTAASLLNIVIVLNVTIMIVGIIWARRQVKRVAAERAAQYRSLFVLEPLSPQGEAVQILVDDETGPARWMHRNEVRSHQPATCDLAVTAEDEVAIMGPDLRAVIAPDAPDPIPR